MRVEQFAMERMQSTWENLVDVNLSESGVHPMTPRELLEEKNLELVLDQALVYTQSNGTTELRTLIAAMYPGSSPDHIQVTNGGSEANYISIWRLVEPGDDVVMLVPNYMQTWGLVRGFGGTVSPEAGEVSRKRPAERARIVEHGKPCLESRQDSGCFGLAELLQFLRSRRNELDLPGQARPSAWRG
jgi:hypothetical protein